MNRTKVCEQSSQAAVSDRPGLVVGIVARNDGERLRGTIADALEIADRVLLLDLGSTDGSVESARSLGADVRSVSADTGKAQAKNALIDIVETENEAQWLLWLNPGERFDRAARTAFDFFLVNQLEQNRAYMMMVRRSFHDSNGMKNFHGGASPQCRRCERDEEMIELRLMPLRAGLRFSRGPKESLFASIAGTTLGLCAAPGRILQAHPFESDDFLRREAAENLALLVALEAEGVAIENELLLCRAESRRNLGDYAGAKADFELLLEQSPYANYQLEAIYRINELYVLRPGGGDEQTLFLTNGIEKFPLDFQLLTFMGIHLQRMRRHDMAVRTFETALNYGRMSFDVWHRCQIQDMAALALSNSYRLLGSLKLATETLATYLEAPAENRELSLHLLDLYIAGNQEIKARQLGAILWGERQASEMRAVVTGACRASAGAWEAASLPLEGAFLEGCRESLCLRWYSLTLLALMKFEEAMPVLELWCEKEPDSVEARAFRFAAATPDRFLETLREIQNAHKESLGITTLETLGLHESETRKKQDEELAWSILGVDPEHDSHSVAMRQMVESSGNVPLPYAEGVSFQPSDKLIHR